MKPVRWGILGVSKHFITRMLLPMRNAELVEVYGIASRNAVRAQQASEQFNIPCYFSSYEALLEDSSIEAVYIPLPNHIHLEWIKKSADAGKHILCEKPLALHADEAQEAIDYTGEKGVLLMEAFMYRFHSQWKHAAELAGSGAIGTIRSAHTFFSYHNADPNNIRNILETGGGALYDIGCYAVSAARFIFDREPARVISLMERSPDFHTDVLSSGILDFEGAHMTFTVGTQAFPHQRVDILGSGGRMHIRIPFNTFDDVPAAMTVINSVGTREIQFDPESHYEVQCNEFSRAVRNGGPVPIPPEDARNNCAVLDALFRSEKTGKWETVRL